MASRLQAEKDNIKNQIKTVFGEFDMKQFDELFEAQTKYLRWSAVLGQTPRHLLRIKKPNFGMWLIGMLEESKKIQVTEEAWIFDGIKIPHFVDKKDGQISAIVLPNYCRRKLETFDGAMLFDEEPYEHENVFLQESDVVFDCGANLGIFSSVASRCGCRVFAFEAIPAIIDNYLSKTAEMNGNIGSVLDLLN